MIITYLLLALYLTVFTLWLRRDRFVSGAGLGKGVITALFWLKILIAWVYGWVGGPLYQYKFDTWIIHEYGLKESKWLQSDFYGFWHDAFTNSYYQENLLVKLTAIWNLFSNGSYLINALFFSFFTFYGIIAFVRLYQKIWPEMKQWIIYSFCLLPSFLFWGNGMYKDGWIFTGISLAAYGVYSAERKFSNYLIVLAGVAILLIFRTYTAVIVIPCFVYYSFARKWQFKYFTSGLLACSVVGVVVLELSGIASLPEILASKRAAFLKLEGDSILLSTSMPADWWGFWSFLPSSLQHVLVRPFPWEAMKQLFYLPEAIQGLVMIALLIVWCRYKGWQCYLHPMAKLLLVIALVNFFVIGYTVPFLGAIVRYKSIYLPFIALPLLYGIRVFEKKLDSPSILMGKPSKKMQDR